MTTAARADSASSAVSQARVPRFMVACTDSRVAKPPPSLWKFIEGSRASQARRGIKFSELFENRHLYRRSRIFVRGEGEVSKKSPLASRLAGIEDKKQNSCPRERGCGCAGGILRS